MSAPVEVVEYVTEATIFAGPLAEAIAQALHDVSTTNGVGWVHVVGRKRSQALGRARCATAKALRDLVTPDGHRLSLEEIGLILGGREHTSVLYLLGALKRQAVVA